MIPQNRQLSDQNLSGFASDHSYSCQYDPGE
jgi:hypothetical protein